MNLTEFKARAAALQEEIYFDKCNFLREKAVNPSKLKKLLNGAQGLLEDSNQEEEYFLYACFGNFNRIIGNTDDAICYLTHCLDLAISKKEFAKEAVSLIRLGEAYKYAEKHEHALEKFNKALDICDARKLKAYKDFALQHKGKCLMEMGRLEEAGSCFQAALEIRETKGDTSLVESTKQAVDLLNTIKHKTKD